MQLIGVGADHCGRLALQGAAHAADLFEQLHLQLDHLVGTAVVGIGVDLLRFGFAEPRVVGQQAIGAGPAAARVLPGPSVGQRGLGEQEHALGAGTHHLVEQRNHAVDVLLRVDDVLDHGMHLAVGERVELDDEGVAAVGPRRVILGEQVAHRTEPAAVPHGGDVPARGDVGAGLEAMQGADGLDGQGALVAVVAHDDLATLERPHLDGAALAVAGVPEVRPQLRVGAPDAW